MVLIVFKNLLTVLKTAMAAVIANRLRQDWTLKILDQYLNAPYGFHTRQRQGCCSTTWCVNPWWPPRRSRV